MSTLLINGLGLSAIMATASEPKSERRDIGDDAVASDGTTRVTRQTSKVDLSFTSTQLTNGDAFAWQSLICGEGEVFPFDASLYGSKGLGPSASTAATLVSSHPKFGAKNLQLGATTGTITFSAAALNIFAAYVGHTVMVWRYESAAWHHYVVRSDGTIWKDGSTAGSPTATWLTVNTTTGDVTIANTSGSAVEYDDLVVLPFQVLDAWPGTFAAATRAFPGLPMVELSGDLVPEQSYRQALGTADDQPVKTASGVRHKLDVKLKAR